MRDRSKDLRQRPRLKGYLWLAGILLTVWISFLLIIIYNAQVENRELVDMEAVMRWGVASILGMLVLAYSTHWWGKSIAYEKAELATYKSSDG